MVQMMQLTPTENFAALGEWPSTSLHVSILIPQLNTTAALKLWQTEILQKWFYSWFLKKAIH